MKKILAGLLILFLAGCSTIATRDKGETLKIRGTGKAVWPDGASIEGKSPIQFPETPPIRIER